MHQLQKLNKVCVAQASHRLSLSFLLYSIFFLSISAFSVFSAQSDLTSGLNEYLVQQKSLQEVKFNEIERLSKPANFQKHEHLRQKLQILQRLNKVNAANLKNLLGEQKNETQKLNNRLKSTQLMTEGEISQNPGQAIQNIKVQLQAHAEVINLIKANLSLTEKISQLLIKKQLMLAQWKTRTEAEIKIKALNVKIDSLSKEITKIYQKNITLQEKQSTAEQADLDVNFETQLMLNNQQILLLRSKIAVFEQEKAQIEAGAIMNAAKDVASYEKIQIMHRNVLDRLKKIDSDLSQTRMLLEEEPAPKGQGFKQQYEALLTSFSEEIQTVKSLESKSVIIIAAIEKQIKQQLALRQPLAEYHVETWPTIASELVLIPYKLYLYIKDLSIQLFENFYWFTKAAKFLFWSMVTLIIVGAYLLYHILNRYNQEKIRFKLAGHLYDWILVLLSKNIFQLSLVLLMVFVFYFCNLPYSQYQLLIGLIIVWLVFRNVILLGRLMLLDRVSDVSGEDVKLYYRLKYLMLYGGIITACMVLSHQLPLSILMQDIFNRLFMLFILALSVGIWKSKEAIPYLLKPMLKAKKKYVRRAIVLLITLIPITLFSTAIIGLVGFSNLAWTMSRYQADFLLVITGYVLLRGLISDLLELISEIMINSLKNGWLWIEVILKPIDKISRFLLFLLSIFILFQLYGWSSDSLVVKNLHGIINYPVVNISGIKITLLSFLQFTILLYIFLWAAKWAREFGYRWLYRNARDAGVRNSLSAFTQYGVIIVGTFITLRVLGIDFSGMSMILGGLAVGMGFGLRDFASNIIGGVMLLIERPVREGDLITLGDYEGRVAHIGIRSMRVSSWDNMEVLIPNAETFNKPFTNWTHQDNIVRSVIPIKVNPSDDPVFIQQLILDVLAIIPEILDGPPPQVYLKHINEALIEFEVRYYINVLENTRFAVRSKVLFAITAQFKAAGVKPPIPPLSVEVIEHEQSNIKLPKK